VIYKVDGYYAPESDGGVLWNDPALGIDWGIDPAEAIVSDKDAALPLFADAFKF
jgi:dTDP-4-dehydrorhamnose 3,5-epimerase